MQKDDNLLFPAETCWFVSGRSALKAILAENHFKTAAIPIWCCESMITPFMDSQIEVTFYIDKLPQSDVALVMDHFGYSFEDSAYKEFDGIIIRDLTHSLLSKPHYDADYYFGSLRKWAGFWTGGFAWGFHNQIRYQSRDTEYNDYINLRKEAMSQKEKYMNGAISSKDYLNLLSQAESILDSLSISPAEERDIELAKRLDTDFIKAKRRNNAEILKRAFSDNIIFKSLDKDDCPMFVPVRIKSRNELRAYLIQNEIYCPVHWPVSQFHQLNGSTKQLYEEELSLVCDQRYCAADMQRMVDTIHNFERR